ncbi:hypothetical protein [Bradyrhizobium sp. CCBAU 53421]|nr:hypothetical protein [Bradyrhizobium sp. CCBAU 53421]
MAADNSLLNEKALRSNPCGVIPGVDCFVASANACILSQAMKEGD